MFPSKRSMHMSSVLGRSFHFLAHNFARIQYGAVNRSSIEFQYFRNLFPEIAQFLNGTSIEDLHISCQAKEIHQKPIIRYDSRSWCELGDYFVNVKYYDQGKMLGRRLVAYQFKMEQAKRNPQPKSQPSIRRRWKIDPKQLRLLCDWPMFRFGKSPTGINSFTLSPRSPDLGSYWLAQRDANQFCSPCDPVCLHFDFIAPAMSILTFRAFFREVWDGFSF